MLLREIFLRESMVDSDAIYGHNTGGLKQSCLSICMYTVCLNYNLQVNILRFFNLSQKHSLKKHRCKFKIGKLTIQIRSVEQSITSPKITDQFIFNLKLNAY